MPKSKSERKSREESSSDEENPRPPKRRSRTQPTKVNEQPKETSERSQLFLLFFASLLIMAVMIEYCADQNDYEKKNYGTDRKCDLDDRRGFALAVGVISLAFTCFMLAMSFLASSVYETIAPIFAILLFVLWAPGAYLTTIKGPFSETPRSDAAEEFIAKRTGFLGMWAGFFLSFSILKSRLVA